MPHAHIRIDSHEDVVTNAKIIHVAEDGTETDISPIVTEAHVHLVIGEAAYVELKCFFARGEQTAMVGEFVLTELDNSRRLRLHRGKL